MAINKIVLNTDSGDRVLVDLTGDSVTPETTFAGKKGHGANGEPFTGTFSIDNELSAQDSLIERIQTALHGKSAGGENLDEVLAEQDNLIAQIQAAIAAKAAK